VTKPSRWGALKNKAVDAATKANDARLERKAEQAATQSDRSGPIAEWAQSRASNTIRPEKIVLHPDRVEHVAKAMTSRSSASIGLGELAQVRVDSKLMYATLLIESSGGSSIVVEKMGKDDAEQAKAAILDAAQRWRSGGIGAAPAPPPPAAGDVTAKLAELASLHASGALTDDEFAAAKGRLLA
jgi:hypothetical protein